ncbi:UBX domain-containing protein [Rutstroemia sp. NJR-2017a WRK4]|nr:UBX domain-containing protein [Rutstroemia sp. NJR-2017a WRK4]
MFYNGDLNIMSTCFLKCILPLVNQRSNIDGNEESQLWEDDFLKDPEVNRIPLKHHMQEKAITLRLEAGSQEANYLAAIFPVPKVPTLVLIKYAFPSFHAPSCRHAHVGLKYWLVRVPHWRDVSNNGELKEYIASGVTKDDFTLRLGRALGLGSAADNSRARGSAEVTDPSVPEQTIERGTSHSSDVPTSRRPLTEPLGTPTSDQVDNKVATEQTSPQEPAQGPPRPSGSTSYADTQRKIQQDAKDERERVRKLIDDDKIARRVRETERKAKASGAATEKPTTPNNASTSSKSENCALQIRLFDGSTIRSRFPSSSTLNKEWIDEQRTDDTPYVFKQILSPLPNRNISMTEEVMDVKSLGLMPSATLRSPAGLTLGRCTDTDGGFRLILVPVHEYASSYEGSNTPGLLWRGISGGYRLGSWGLNQIMGSLRNIVNGPATNPTESPSTTTSTTATPANNLRSLRDRHRDTDDHQLYNGNTLNFEPRKDEASDEN